MTKLKTVYAFLREKPDWQSVGTHWYRPEQIKATAEQIVRILLEEEPMPTLPLCEASVHKSRRSTVYVAYFTGAEGGQVWKSTGCSDYVEAIRVARRLEAQARLQRARQGGASARTGVRLRGAVLTQKETAQLLGLSERAVRNIEKRALRKLAHHPALRQFWQQYLTGTVEESALTLTSEEVAALFDLAREPQELRLIEKIIHILQ